jgi:hypothetical protein
MLGILARLPVHQVLGHNSPNSPRLPFLSFLMFSPLERRCQGIQGSFMYCKFIVLEDFIHKCNAKVEGPGCSKSFMYSFLAKLQMSRSSQSQHKFHDTWGQGFPLLTQQLALDIQWLRGINTYIYISIQHLQEIGVKSKKLRFRALRGIP